MKVWGCSFPRCQVDLLRRGTKGCLLKTSLLSFPVCSLKSFFFRSSSFLEGGFFCSWFRKLGSFNHDQLKGQRDSLLASFPLCPMILGFPSFEEGSSPLFPFCKPGGPGRTLSWPPFAFLTPLVFFFLREKETKLEKGQGPRSFLFRFPRGKISAFLTF